MPIIKQVETPTGGRPTYHKVHRIEATEDTCEVVVNSWIDEAAYVAGTPINWQETYISQRILTNFGDTEVMLVEPGAPLEGGALVSSPTELTTLQARLCSQVDAQMRALTLSPIEVDGARFDADEVSRGRITNMVIRLQVAGLPIAWLGWRDADNQMRWQDNTAEDVLAQLVALKSAVEDREQVLLIAAWQHKAAILGNNDAEALKTYSIYDNWPQ